MTDFNRPSDFEIWNHMRTQNEFRIEAERKSEELRQKVEEVSDELKEILLCITIVRKIVPWFWGVVMFLVGAAGTVIGMLYKLVPPGSL